MLPKVKVTTLLVDNEPTFCESLACLLRLYSNVDNHVFTIVGEASDGESAVAEILYQQPRLVLLDMELNGNSDGLQVLHKLSQTSYKGKVIILSSHREDTWIFNAMQAGASGYLFKSHLPQHLCQAITAVLNNDIYVPQEVATRFFRLFSHRRHSSLSVISSLTERELEILHWLVRGESNEEIAAHSFISVATVKARMTTIFEKLNINSRTQAVITALKYGLVSTQD
jgi:DNA-binding NarL/FixJ family response regulator